MKHRLIVALAVAFVSLVVLANWLASAYVIDVPLTPYKAPAGVLAIGAVLVLRDWIQQLAGLWRSLALIYLAGAISYIAGVALGWTDLQKIAIASVIAFTVSETIEALVFTPLRKRNLTLGVGLSATVGNVIDSYLFLTIAFGSLAFFWGQFWGKTEMILIGVLLTFFRRRLLPAGVTT